MLYLLLVSCVWAFSFGIIGHTLDPVPSPLICAIRMCLSFLVFAPFFKRTAPRDARFFMLLGAIQFGGMYLAYIQAFKHLASHQIALLTLTTPLWIAMLDGLRNRRFVPLLWAATGLATLGAVIFAWTPGGFSRLSLQGVLLMQVSNLCFAFGQWTYRRRAQGANDPANFFWMYLGALLITLPFAWQHLGAATNLTLKQIQALLYLGLVASGLCFFLWNLGARRVSTARMAVMNDLKIPLGVLVSFYYYNETADLPRLLLGGLLLLAAIWLGGVARPGKG